MRRLPIAVLALLAAACSREPTTPRPQAERDAGPPPPPPDELIVALAPAGDLSVAEVERQLTAPVEDALARVPSVAHLRSLTTRQEGRIAGRLSPGSDSAAAARDVADALRRASLPPGVAPPSVARRAHGPSLRTVVSSPALSTAEMARVRDDVIRPALERVRGVSGVSTCGGAGAEAVLIRVDLDRLSASGLDLAAIEAALARAGGSGMPVFRSLEELSATPLGTGGAPIALRDVAMVELASEPATCAAFDGEGHPVLSIEVAIDPAFGPLAASARLVSERRAALAAELPGGITFSSLEAPTAALLELRVETPNRIDAQRLADTARALARGVAGVAGVNMVLVESGAPATATARPELPALRALVLLGQPAAATPVIAAAEVAAAGVGVRAVSGPLPEVRIQLLGTELDALDRAAQSLAGSLRSLPGVGAAGVSSAGVEPRVHVVPDPQRLAELGLTRDAVDRVVHLVLDGAAVAELAEGPRRIPVRLDVGAAPGGTSSPTEILPRVRLRGKSGAMVPLSSAAALELRAEPAALLHVDRRRAVEVWLRLSAGAAEGGVIAAARGRAGSADIPAGVELVWPDAPRAAP
jgi:multidrug efflux pump subunit AcrB